MKLQKYKKLRDKFEGLSFESNFSTINKTLYYFSYLGNVFLILFSYFFLKTVTDTIPTLFTGQAVSFSIFIVLFMTGYELFKRFAIEQLFQNWFLNKKATIAFLASTLVCVALTVGSFYLSVKGSHRLIDNAKTQTAINDTLINAKVAQLQARHDISTNTAQKQFDNVTSLINKLVDASSTQSRTLTKAEQKNISKWELQLTNIKLEKARLDSIFKADTKIITNGSKISDADLAENEENNLAFLLLTFFLEILIIVGVGFTGYYNVCSYNQMKTLMQTEKYQKLTNNLSMLRAYYHNGSKIDGDTCPPTNKFTSVAKSQIPNLRGLDVVNFLNILNELQITQSKNKKSKVFAVSYDKALALLQDEKIKI